MRRRFLSTLGLSLILAVVGSAALAASPWVSFPTELRKDPALHEGVLANGLRFLILTNNEPKDRVSLRLVVATGSLYESDNERGLAHFIEHMAFRGTKKYPRSTLVPALEKMGMGLGPDTAAFTSYDFTDYQLELPDRGAATLSYGLDVLREFSENITFAPADIATERGVVLSEMALRDTVDDRLRHFNLGLLWPGSRVAKRSPIGTRAALESFGPREFRAFYDAWYRPERMALVVVGQVDPVQVEAAIRQAFASLQGRGVAHAVPADLRPTAASPEGIQEWQDQGFAGVGIILEHARAWTPDRWNSAGRIERIRAALAMSILQRRFHDLTLQPNAAVAEANAYLDESVMGWSSASISVAARGDNARRALSDAQAEFRRAFEQGFSAEELREAQANYRSAVERTVENAPTRSSADLAGELMIGLLTGVPFCSPADAAADQLPIVAATTLPECCDAFRRSWGTAQPRLLVAMNSGYHLPLKDLEGLVAANQKAPLPARAATLQVAFPYTHFGPAGQLVERHHLDDLDITYGKFTNGVRLNLKPTKLEAQSIDFSLRVGRGRQSMPSQPGLDRLADFGFLTGGLKGISTEGMESVLAGHSISFGFQVTNDAFLFYGRCSPSELKLSLQLAAAFLTDPGFRPDAISSVRASAHAGLSRMRESSVGMVDYFAESYLTNFDHRFWPGSDRDIDLRTYAEMDAWMRPELTSGAVEAAVVGDLDVETVVREVADTLGAIGRRPDPAALSWKPVRFASAHSRFLLFSNPTVRDNCVAVCWPAPFVQTVAENRRCDVLTRLLTERIMTRVREDLGATYSPQVNFMFDQGLPGRTYLMAKVGATREHAARIEQIILEEAASLAREPVNAETFERARQPLLRERADQIRTNSYWNYLVMWDLQQRPERIENARDRDRDYASIDAAEVERYAARIFRPDAAYRFLTLPSPGRSGN